MEKAETRETISYVEQLQQLAVADQQYGLSPECYLKICVEAREAWASAAFSERSEASLKRYFNFQLRLLCDALDSPCQLQAKNNGVNTGICDLLEHLLRFFSEHLAWDIQLSGHFLQARIPQLRHLYNSIMAGLDDSTIDADVRLCISGYLDEVFETIQPQLNMGEWAYLNIFLFRLRGVFKREPVKMRQQMIKDALIALNFNHLGFFQYLCAGFASECPVHPKDRLRYLRNRLATIPEENYGETPAFSPAWPSLLNMTSRWIKEEIIVTEKNMISIDSVQDPVPSQKICLNLPVAYLACLIRLFYETGLYASTNLSDIFRSAALHYSSKRKTAFSPGNISKEYYTINQHTAARVLDILQKMIAHLKLSYFPVWAAVSVIVFFY
jgi:hypothetical protein